MFVTSWASYPLTLLQTLSRLLRAVVRLGWAVRLTLAAVAEQGPAVRLQTMRLAHARKPTRIITLAWVCFRRRMASATRLLPCRSPSEAVCYLKRPANAAEVTYTGSGAATATTAANPLGNYRVHESRLAYRRIVASGVTAADAKKWWFIGDFKKAFAYMENWPITVTQAPIGSEAEFNNDVVLRFKASERGAAAVLNPRYVVKCTG